MNNKEETVEMIEEEISVLKEQTKVGKKYLPDALQNERKKPKLTLKQLFFLKGKGKR